MAESLFIASIVCFILSGVLFIVTIALFFSLKIQNTIRKLMGQNQAAWIMNSHSDKDKKKSKKKAANSGRKHQYTETTYTLMETPANDEEELPTVLDNGEEKLDSLVSVYNEENLTITDDNISNALSGITKITTVQETTTELEEEKTAAIGLDDSSLETVNQLSFRADSHLDNLSDKEKNEYQQYCGQFPGRGIKNSDLYTETEDAENFLNPLNYHTFDSNLSELETELEEATENPDDTGKKFQILQTIMYVHTDEVI
jgi:hypothetical protein